MGSTSNVVDLTGVTAAAFGSMQSTEVAAGPGNDTVRGSDFRDRFLGGDGNDELFGNGGNDELIGGTGTNSLDGGDGDAFWT